jgi:hypothetical protein
VKKCDEGIRVSITAPPIESGLLKRKGGIAIDSVFHFGLIYYKYDDTPLLM